MENLAKKKFAQKKFDNYLGEISHTDIFFCTLKSHFFLFQLISFLLLIIVYPIINKLIKLVLKYIR